MREAVTSDDKFDSLLVIALSRVQSLAKDGAIKMEISLGMNISRLPMKTSIDSERFLSVDHYETSVICFFYLKKCNYF